MRRLYQEATENLVRPPSFTEFFSQEAKGRSPFDKATQGHEEVDEQEELDRIMAEENDEDSYRRELMARMFGGKLSARQYGVLMRMNADNDEQLQINKAQDYKTKIEAKD